MRPFAAAFFAVFLGCVSPLWSEPGIASAVAEFRKAEGVSVPVLSDEFSAACTARARTLAEAGVLSHNDGKGRGPGVQMLSLGFPPGEYGEILGSGATWDAVWAAWQASKPHREVLVSDGWTRWGWGRFAVGNTEVWVVRFYRP